MNRCERLSAVLDLPQVLPASAVRHGLPGKICGIDVGSTTCKYVLASPSGEILAQAYERHNWRQAVKVLDFLGYLEKDCGLEPGVDRLFLTGSGAEPIARQLGACLVQEVAALAAAVEIRHPGVRFVSEIGGEDMKTLFFGEGDSSRHRQLLMQAACSGGMGACLEKTARQLRLSPSEQECLDYRGWPKHKISFKCGVFAEADINALIGAGAPPQEIMASLFDSVVYQNLATLTRGNTPRPEVLLLGGAHRFFPGLQQAWAHHLQKLWGDVEARSAEKCRNLVIVPPDGQFYAALGCLEWALRQPGGVFQGSGQLRRWLEQGQADEKKRAGRAALWRSAEDAAAFQAALQVAGSAAVGADLRPSGVVIGCDFGSTTAKAVCLSVHRDVLFTCYAPSLGNPIEDARSVFGQMRQAGISDEILAVGITGVAKDLLKNLIGADCAVAETVAHATGALHIMPDADCICEVGGTGVKVMLLHQGVVSDFRFNSECSSGHGNFLQGLAESFAIPLDEVAEQASRAEVMPQFSMGCGVFLQSEICEQQRNGWHAQEILAAVCAVLPMNVWIYAAGLHNLKQAGKKFLLQGGLHKNLAVVKAQVDYITSKVPEAVVRVHPQAGEAAAVGAGLVALDWCLRGGASGFRGFLAVESMTYEAKSSAETACPWCPTHCQRIFLEVQGKQRAVVNSSCCLGQAQCTGEKLAMETVLEKVETAFPNVATKVRLSAFS